MLARFVNEICECQGDWNMPDYVAEAVARITAETNHLTDLAVEHSADAG